MRKIIENRTIYLIIILLVSVFNAAAQSENILTLTAADLQNGKIVELGKTAWKYRASDEAAWAARDFDDHDWKSVTNAQINADLSTLENWNGRAWFRLKIRVDDSLVNQPVAARMWHWGATETYLDGNLIASYGTIEPETDTEFNPRGLIFPVVFTSGGEHTIAIRYSNEKAGDLTSGRGRWLARGGTLPGFKLELSAAGGASLNAETDSRAERVDYVFIGIMSALALVHFLLFVFYRRARGNLFYSFFVFGLAVTMLASSFARTAHLGATAYLLADSLRLDLQAFAVISLLAFLYVEFAERPSRFFWILVAGWIIALAFNTAKIFQFLPFILLMLGLTLADSLRIVLQTLVKKREGAWIIAVGIVAFVFCVASNVASEREIIQVPEWLYQSNLYATLLTVPLAVSIYLARNFARTNRHLEAQLEQVRDLSARQLEQERRESDLRFAHERTQAENERRAKELEEARQLQLSLLPKKLPVIPNLEIAAYMKPASEVGGDYYDFHTAKDGTLTVAVGDATGHGLKAGTVVAATKSLFNAFAEQENIPQIFKQTSGALKKMNLRGLFMAMAMLKIKDGAMTLCVAGMPSVLIYRAAIKTIEEIAVRAMPLGSVSKFEYQQKEIALAPNDIVVLLSDGFPEMFNEAGEMLGDDRARKILSENPHLQPNELIEQFIETAEQWRGARPADDDVTFVVLKFK